MNSYTELRQALEEIERETKMPNSDENQLNAATLKIESTVGLPFLLGIVPEYDGYNIPLQKFQALAETALNAVSEEVKPLVFATILQKLKGKAEKAVAHRLVDSGEELFEILSQQFDAESTITVLLSELLRAKGDNARDAGNRIAALRDKLCISIQNEHIKNPDTLIEKLALVRYMSTLPSEIALIIKAKDPSTLDRAIEIAVEEERFNKYKKESYSSKFKPQQKVKSKYYKEKRTNNNKNEDKEKPENSNPKMCDYCKKPGHTVDNCYKKRDRKNVRVLERREESDTDSSCNENDDLNSEDESSDGEVMVRRE